MRTLYYSAVQNDEPAYRIAAADHTLRLLLVLAERRSLRVVDAAAELDVARSTAHRLLQMLVYRRFAVQLPDRSYGVGPALIGAMRVPDPVVLRTWLRPAMDEVHRLTGETVHLMTRSGTEVVFLESLESRLPLRVASRAGMRLPAHEASGGRALLALVPVEELRSLYSRRPDVDLPALERGLRRVRQQGFGMNIDVTEAGISAVGVAVVGPAGDGVAAIAVSAPSLRFRRGAAADLAAVLHHAVTHATAPHAERSDPGR